MHTNHSECARVGERLAILPHPHERSAQLLEAIDQIIVQAHDERVAQERRASIRHPYPFLVRAIPADRHGNRLAEAPLTVIGKHVSFEGFGFFHTTPIAHRHVVVEFATGPQSPPIRLLMNLIWCRFLREGWYDSGGKFVQVVGDQPA